MPALNPGDQILWRTHPQDSDNFLWVDNPPIVLACRVNQASFTYPITSPVNFDGITSGSVLNVEPGMLIVFGTAAGKDDRGRTVVKGITGSTVGVPRISQGTVDGTVNLEDNLFITIYDYYPIFAKIPYIDKTTGETFKDGDRAFLANMAPIANIGYAHIYARNVNPATDLLTLVLDSSDSFATMGGATLASRLWDVKDGTITVGTSSSVAITVTFPVGRRVIKLSLTDSNGQVQTRRLTVVACKPGTAYAAITDFTPNTLTQTVEGLKMSFKLGQDLPATTYLDRTQVCYWREEYFNASTSQQLNSTSVVKFAGWLRNIPSRVDAQPTHLLRETTLECVDTCGELAALPGFPQAIERVATPIRWEEMADPNIDRFLVYLWLFHSYAPSLADFMWTGAGSSYPLQRLNSSGTNLYAQIDGRAKAIGYRLLSTAKGRARCKKDPLLFDAGDRDSTNTVDILEGDWKFLGWTHQRPSRSHWNRGSAVVASSSEYLEAFCRAPGSVPAQGPSASDIGEMLVTSQTELNKRVGHNYARENSFFSYFDVELLHGGDIGLEPLDFVRLNMGADTAAQRGHTFANQRCMVVAIYTDTEQTYGTSRVRATLEVETFGTPAEPEIPDPDPIPAQTPVTELYPPDDTVVTALNPLAAFDTDGLLWITPNYKVPSASGGPEWAFAALTLVGTPVAFVVDAYSPKFITGSGAVNGWLVTTSRIYRVTDIFGTVGVASQFTFRAAITGIGGRSLDASFSVQNWLIVSSYYAVDSAPGDRGVWTTYTTDGSTWATEQQLSCTVSNFFLQFPGLHVSSKAAGLAYTTIMTGASGNGPGSAGRVTNDYGASWAALSSPNLNGINLAFDIHVPYHDNPSESIAYRAVRDQPTAVQKLYRVSGSTQTDITPIVSSKAYTMEQYGKGALATNPTNRQRVVLCAAHNDDLSLAPSHFATFASLDAGDTWIVIDGPNGSGKYRQASITDDNTIFLWGDGGRVGISTDFATIDERGPAGSGRIIGITGG